MIIFNEEKHSYTNSETNEKYISVTTLLGNIRLLSIRISIRVV